jgi:hypothetical protein
MASNINSTLPVTRILSSTPIALSDAASMLSAYTEESRTNPSLHPDCELTAHGPKFPQEGSQGTSVVELLRRISRGMAGEQLGSADAILKQIRDRHLELGSRDDYVETLKHPAKEVIVDEPEAPTLEPALEVIEESTKRAASTDRRKSKDVKKKATKSSTKSRERSAAGSELAAKSTRKRKRKDDET